MIIYYFILLTMMMMSSSAVTTTVSLEQALRSVVRLPSSPAFVLGSSSSSRQQLLRATGAIFETFAPDIDEKAIGDRANGDAVRLVREVALAKADALVSQFRDDDNRILLTGDQVVTYDGAVREKPENIEECRAFIRSYSEKPCATVGAVCLHSLRTGKRVIGVHHGSVHFKQLPEALVDDLLAKDGPALLRCAGGLMIEHPLVAPYILDVQGGVDSIMGLSTKLVKELLDELLLLDKTPAAASS